MISLLISLLLPTAFGYAVILCFFNDREMTVPFKMALAYGLGLGLLAQWILMLGALNKSFSFNNTAFPMLIMLMILLLFIYVRNPSFKTLSNHSIDQGQKSPFDLTGLLFQSFIVFILFYIFFKATHVPIASWDAFSCHTFKAKTFYYDRSLMYFDSLPHNPYPLHVNFLQMWISMNYGTWDDQVIKILFPVYFLSFITILYSFLKTYTSKNWSLFGVVLFLSSSFAVFHSTVSYRDLTLQYYLCTAIMLLVLSHTYQNPRFLFLASLFAGFMTFVKLEAAGYLAVFILLFTFYQIFRKEVSLFKKFKELFTFVVPSSIMFSVYQVYKLIQIGSIKSKSSLSFDLNNINLNMGAEFVTNLYLVLLRFVENILTSGNWNILWLLLFVSIVGHKRRLNFEIMAILVILTSLLGAQLLGYSITQYGYWVIKTNYALSRHLLHHFPLIVILIVMLQYSIFKEE